MNDWQRDVDRAEHAQRLLNDELLQAALSAIKADVVQMWIDCPARDTQGKEALWQLAKTADKFTAILQGHIETGKVSRDKLKRFEESPLRRVFG